MGFSRPEQIDLGQAWKQIKYATKKVRKDECDMLVFNEKEITDSSVYTVNKLLWFGVGYCQ